MGKIYLIRHGETDSNLGHKFQGQMDLPLNATGLAQARQMAAYMADKKIDAIYSMVFAEEKELPINLNQEVDDSVFDLTKEG